MKDVLIIILLTLAYSQLGSQTVIVSDEVGFKSDFRYEVMPMDKDEVLLFKDEVFEQKLISFDNNLKKKWEKTLSFEKKKIGFIGIVPLGEVFSIYYFFREQNDIYILSRSYSSEGNLMKTDTLIREKYLSGIPGYYFAVSPKKKKGMIFSIDRNDLIDGYGLDLESNTVEWARKLEKTEGITRLSFRDVLLTDAGEPYFIFELNNRWKKKKKHQFRVLQLREGAPIATIEMEGVLSYDHKVTFNVEQEKIFFASSYSQRPNNRCNGLITALVDLASMDVISREDLVFNADLESSPSLERLDDSRGIEDLTVRYLVPRRDNGIVVLCESAKEYTRRPSFSSSSSITRRWVDYYFEDILAFSINAKGDMDWYEVLHKKQYSQDDDAAFSSFFMFQIPAQIRLIYNDEIRNANTVSEYVVTSKGVLERKSLMSTDQVNLKLKFREAIQIDNKTVVVPSMKGNKMMLVKIIYDNYWTP